MKATLLISTLFCEKNDEYDKYLGDRCKLYICVLKNNRKSLFEQHYSLLTIFKDSVSAAVEVYFKKW